MTAPANASTKWTRRSNKAETRRVFWLTFTKGEHDNPWYSYIVVSYPACSGKQLANIVWHWNKSHMDHMDANFHGLGLDQPAVKSWVLWALQLYLFFQISHILGLSWVKTQLKCKNTNAKPWGTRGGDTVFHSVILPSLLLSLSLFHRSTYLLPNPSPRCVGQKRHLCSFLPDSSCEHSTLRKQQNHRKQVAPTCEHISNSIHINSGPSVQLFGRASDAKLLLRVCSVYLRVDGPYGGLVCCQPHAIKRT